ncbi:MAG: hypothetical protein U9M89_02270 [Patescibacteria group bacterium]|nr:hypothetical protein [Patescibacteria group bacterium]
MNTVLTVSYLVLLVFAFIYAGINVYHVVKYRSQLPVKDAKGSTMVIWVYGIASLTIVIFSAVVALFYIYSA